MSLPAAWSLVPVTATYPRRDGQPAVGRVLFESEQVVYVDGQIVVPRTLVAQLDEAGSIAIELPSTIDPSIAPQGWTYTVREQIFGMPDNRAWALQVPHDSPGINLATAAPSVPVAASTPLVRQVTQLDAPLDLNGLMRVRLNYTPAVEDPNLIEIYVDGVLASWMNEWGAWRGQVPPTALFDSMFRAIQRVGQTGKVWVYENAARDTELFAIDPNDGATWRSGVKYADLATDAGHASSTGPEMYGVKLLTTPPEICVSGGASNPGIQTIQAARVWVHQPVTVERVAAYVRTVIGTPDPAGVHGYAVYADDGSDTLTRVAATPNDTALFQTAAWRDKAFAAPVALQPKRAYWLAFVTSYSTGTPVFASTQATGANPLTNGLPGGRTAISWAAQTSFPTTLSKAAGAASAVRFCLYAN